LSHSNSFLWVGKVRKQFIKFILRLPDSTGLIQLERLHQDNGCDHVGAVGDSIENTAVGSSLFMKLVYGVIFYV
jgi:hypothetical protein